MAKIILTVFANVQPGLHQELPDLENGEVTELKFSSSRGTAVLDEPENEDEGEGKAPQRKAERSLRIYLSVSAGRERERDLVLEEVIPKIFEKCSRRSIAVSYVDNRHSWVTRELGCHCCSSSSSSCCYDLDDVVVVFVMAWMML